MNSSTMSRTLTKRSLALLFSLLTITAHAQDSVKVKAQSYKREALNGRCVIESTYPEVVGRPDLTAKIKAILPQPVKAEELDTGEKITITQNFEVTYNGKGLLSVYGAGISSRSRNGEPAEAHPTKLFNGIVLDIKTGKSYSLRELFGQDAHSKLDGPISKAAAKELNQDKPEPFENHTYRAYLSKNGVTFYQIYDIHVLSSLEITLPYSEAVKLRGPASPLERFSK